MYLTAYEVALGALNGAYNYPESVLFKPTLTTAPYTFRPTKAGALSYFIGTDCLLKSGTEDEQFPPGNDGTAGRGGPKGNSGGVDNLGGGREVVAETAATTRLLPAFSY